MIPIRDTLYSRSVPVATYSVMACTVVVFLFQMGMGPGQEQFVYLYGLVPAKYTLPEVSQWFSGFNLLISPVSYMFLHGGFWHFLGNMWFLYIFGDNVEEHLGSLKFLVFYLLCGFCSGVFHFLLNPFSAVPTIGASGSIAGVMGAYFLLYPGAKILTLIPIIIIPWFIEIPAFIFLGIWFFMQFLNAAGSHAGSGIAWWAHVGGFLSGMILLKLSAYLPDMGADKQIKKAAPRRKTPKLQVITPKAMDHSPDLFGTLEISSIEAIAGAKKIVNIPWGFYKRVYRVNVPPGVRQNTKLRLAGMGKVISGTARGDLFLKIDIKNDF
ncbi:MAG: rhomboid family intramembrane serine protease [Thermodesulfobacteriota bacterium]|nr:rhomboid family intramembrane serine protease [Thermodesulfobacteriota bacterium]